MTYSELTRRYFDAAPRLGPLAGAGVRRGSAGARSAGTWVQFELLVAERVIVDCRFLAYGCPHTIACAAWLAEDAVGKPPVATLDVQRLRERFAVPVEKLGKLLIIEDAWMAALGRMGQPSLNEA